MVTPTLYHAYVDGSAYDQHKKYGAGGIILNSQNNLGSTAFSQPLYGEHSSFTAELYAAVHALNILPAGSRVKIHSDFKKLCRQIRQRRLEQWANQERRPENIRACKDLFNAAARHESVKAAYAIDRKCQKTQTAHKLAQAAALNRNIDLKKALRSAKTGRSTKQETEKGNKKQQRRRAVQESLAQTSAYRQAI